VTIPLCSAIIRPFAGSCRYALICIVEKAAALAKDKGILFQSITKSVGKNIYWFSLLPQKIVYFTNEEQIPPSR
jgi:hypothetical protein